jgi:hypothetical protein
MKRQRAAPASRGGARVGAAEQWRRGSRLRFHAAASLKDMRTRHARHARSPFAKETQSRDIERRHEPSRAVTSGAWPPPL